MSKLSQRDQKHLWHPLTQHKTHPNNLAIVKTNGCFLYDEEGNQYIDAIASWYTSMYGHCNTFITKKVALQMQQLDQIVFSGFTHQPAIELSEELMAILPHNQQKIFFSDNGSTAVDIAIKMAIQYYDNKNIKRGCLIAFEEGFHGDTFGAMSVSGLSVYNGAFKDFFLDVKRIPAPSEENLDQILVQLDQITAHNSIAAFIYEPLVQGAAGMKIHDATGLEAILNYFRQKDILTIADEVMTGFGKTGLNFASDHLAIKPDIICLSKALTAGLLPMAITSCTQKVYDAFFSDALSKGFFHGHTYSANPLACAAAIAGIELLRSKKIQDNIKQISLWHQAFDRRIKKHPKISTTRHLGVIFALDLKVKTDRYGDLRDRLFHFFMSRGVFLRPLGNTIYILPPFVIQEAQLEKVYTTIEDALEIV